MPRQMEDWAEHKTAVLNEMYALRARIAELEAALERYGMHLRSCEMLPQDPDREDPGCTCGLNQALRGEVKCSD